MNLPLFLARHLVAITFPFILLMCNHFPIHLSQLQSLSLSSLLLNHFPFNFTHVQSLSHSSHSFSITFPFILLMCNHFPFHLSHLQSLSLSSQSIAITFPFISLIQLKPTATLFTDRSQLLLLGSTRVSFLVPNLVI